MMPVRVRVPAPDFVSDAAPRPPVRSTRIAGTLRSEALLVVASATLNVVPVVTAVPRW